jgi:endonuclease III related protein
MSQIKTPERTLAGEITYIYSHLYGHFGPQHWWPAEEPFEVMVGAILTQSTAWTNVEKAILKIKQAKVLSARAIREIPSLELAELIHSCGYYNAKTIKLKAFAQWFGSCYSDSLEKMFARDALLLRKELLGVHGIGEETADSILLYAGNKPFFVIDSYTRRLFDRLGLGPPSSNYRDYQEFFMSNVTPEASLYGEYHALIVALGKSVCKKTSPLCHECVLAGKCLFSASLIN